ncbi:MAG: hypothetical protein N4A49_07055 [Marinifilaceae bacterium]|jgi:hypothetical protein|nr:hypothetical protein [Marinifilaceae bacterium]
MKTKIILLYIFSIILAAGSNSCVEVEDPLENGFELTVNYKILSTSASISILDKQYNPITDREFEIEFIDQNYQVVDFAGNNIEDPIIKNGVFTCGLYKNGGFADNSELKVKVKDNISGKEDILYATANFKEGENSSLVFYSIDLNEIADNKIENELVVSNQQPAPASNFKSLDINSNKLFISNNYSLFDKDGNKINSSAKYNLFRLNSENEHILKFIPNANNAIFLDKNKNKIDGVFSPAEFVKVDFDNNNIKSSENIYMKFNNSKKTSSVWFYNAEKMHWEKISALSNSELTEKGLVSGTGDLIIEITKPGKYVCGEIITGDVGSIRIKLTTTDQLNEYEPEAVFNFPYTIKDTNGKLIKSGVIRGKYNENILIENIPDLSGTNDKLKLYIHQLGLKSFNLSVGDAGQEINVGETYEIMANLNDGFMISTIMFEAILEDTDAVIKPYICVAVELEDGSQVLPIYMRNGIALVPGVKVDGKYNFAGLIGKKYISFSYTPSIKDRVYKHVETVSSDDVDL